MSVKSNLLKLQLIQALRWYLIVMPIIVLFWQENGLSLKEIFILQAIFSLAIVLFEIPSGYFADLVGRKKSIIIGSTLGFIAIAMYAFSYSFFSFMVAEIIAALGSSFISGADSALIYDTLLAQRKEKDYKKIEGRMLSIGNFAEGSASILGGFIALSSLRTPFYVQAIIVLISIPIALTLVEPKRHKLDNKEGNFKAITKIVKYSLHSHPEIKWLILYSAVIGTSTLTMVWFIQPYLKLVGLPLYMFGIVWALLQFSVGIFSLQAYKIEQYFGRKTSLISLILLTTLGYILLSIFQILWGIVFILIFYFVRGINYPIMKDYINKLITSDMRATVLSVKQMVNRLLFSIVGPFLGHAADIYSLSTAFLFSAGIFLILGSTSLLFLKKHEAL
jgi:MFS family permease